MALSTWWQGDPLPELAPLPGLTVAACADVARLAAINGIAAGEAEARLAAGHRAYLAALDGEPVAYGWVATVGADVGELGLRFSLPDEDRYLWDFATQPAYRGRGIYPRLLQGILAAEGEGASARRFWVIHAPENLASGAGIRKAGFQAVSELSFHREQGVGSQALAGDEHDRATVGARVLGVALVEAVRAGRLLSPCWRCVLAARSGEAEHVPCWERAGEAHQCACILAPAA
ncbi:MAG TPA: GNAT family N-acetyltransferase [Thermomicrobiaceae bacterium]|nr:GNAT family N-acetyltransferase [Thermomicrobiaceae bacterium]